ncbi:MAG: SpoIVB peptidase [Clostridia bacterium]|nr:SpoIVB peptidase [Clostridia bacterium]
MEKTARGRLGLMLKMLGIAVSLLIFALNFTDGMRAARAAGGAIFTNSSTLPADELALIEFLSIGSGSAVPAASDALDERLEGAEPFKGIWALLGFGGIRVYRSERAELLPCGDAIGIAIRSNGVLVVGFGEVSDEGGRSVCPAKACGLRAGDLILAVNGTKVRTAAELQAALNAVHAAPFEGAIELEAERNGNRLYFKAAPARDAGGTSRLGAWVRDSTIGIGTLSFVRIGDDRLAALGHAVQDADTSALIPVLSGEAVFADILGVERARSGTPGELKGSFSSASTAVGSIDRNCELGVYGLLDGGCAALFLGRQTLPVAFPNEVHTGEAYILSQTDDGTPRAYSCRIIRTIAQSAPEPKGLVVEITDEELKSAAGGIVRGMSGSPIVQDGRLAGVVTHVFVNDPLKGYGCYAFWICESMDG